MDMKPLPTYAWIILGLLVLLAGVSYWMFKRQQDLAKEVKNQQTTKEISAYDVIAGLLNQLKSKSQQS